MIWCQLDLRGRADTLQHDQYVDYVTHYVCKELENVNVNLSVTPQYSIVNSITYPSSLAVPIDGSGQYNSTWVSVPKAVR